MRLELPEWGLLLKLYYLNDPQLHRTVDQNIINTFQTVWSIPVRRKCDEKCTVNGGLRMELIINVAKFLARELDVAN
ncbi:hypothetical protein TNCV_1930651 [Trichonephila clavipes]|nr:hypothetical protein TNCV_1930651 [Trichonephila clavipes]